MMKYFAHINFFFFLSSSVFICSFRIHLFLPTLGKYIVCSVFFVKRENLKRGKKKKEHRTKKKFFNFLPMFEWMKFFRWLVDFCLANDCVCILVSCHPDQNTLQTVIHNIYQQKKHPHSISWHRIDNSSLNFFSLFIKNHFFFVCVLLFIRYEIQLFPSVHTHTGAYKLCASE